MGKIGIKQSDKNENDAFFNVDNYYFFRNGDEDNFKEVIESFIKVNLDSNSEYGFIYNVLRDIDQLNYLEEADMKQKEVSIKWLNEYPKENYEYISEYESEIKESQQSIFYDFRKKYIDICKCENINVDINIAFVGYTIVNKEVEIKIKAFNYQVLSIVNNLIVKQFKNQGLSVTASDLRWIRVKEFKTNENPEFYSKDGDKLLHFSTKPYWQNLFEYIFSQIDKNGYIDLNIVSRKKKENEKEEIDDIEKNIKEIKSKILKLKQISSIIKPYLKLECNDHFTYIHDDPALNLQDEINNRVFSFSPRLMQYYEKSWFENFVGKALESINVKNFKIIEKISNNIFNFFGDEKNENEIEIDWILNVEKDGTYKNIGIECKKTLNKHCYTKTKEKLQNKVANTGKDLIDGYIIVGYFRDEKFTKDFNNENMGVYNPENIADEKCISSEKVFIQYLSTASTNFNNLIDNLIGCIDIIVNNL